MNTEEKEMTKKQVEAFVKKCIGCRNVYQIYGNTYFCDISQDDCTERAKFGECSQRRSR